MKNSLEEAIAKRRALIEACERSLSAAAERQRNAFGGSGWGGASSRPAPGSILRLIENKQRHEAALLELESLQTRRAPDDNPSSARERSETPDPPAGKPKLPAKKNDLLTISIIEQRAPKNWSKSRTFLRPLTGK